MALSARGIARAHTLSVSLYLSLHDAVAGSPTNYILDPVARPDKAGTDIGRIDRNKSLASATLYDRERIRWRGRAAGRADEKPKGSSSPLALSRYVAVRTACPLGGEQERVKRFQGRRMSQAHVVIATGSMNDAVYDFPMLIDRSTN